MAHVESGEYVFTITPAIAGAGRTVWRWLVHSADGKSASVNGTSLSQSSAHEAVLQAIARLQVDRTTKVSH